MEVRRLQPGEGPLLREVRLRALRDAPFAFVSTAAREAAFPEVTWEDRVAFGATFVAVQDGRVSGMATVRLREEDPGAAGLYGLWVDPMLRRCGAARALVEACAAWAIAAGAQRLRLAVMADERARPAAALYRATGFVADGPPLRSDDAGGLLIRHMTRAL
jgi:GNAT superfamily N-acetyltransferase